MRHDLPAFARAATGAHEADLHRQPKQPNRHDRAQSEVDQLLADLPKSAVVVLDEAYADFTVGVDDFPNRHSLRVGRAKRGRPAHIQQVARFGGRSARLRLRARGACGCVPPRSGAFYVSSLAQAAGIAALDDDDHLHKTVENNRRGLERLTGAFRAAGCNPF